MEHFVIDSNVFIHGANRWYPMDIFPAFWQKLVELATNGQVVSVDAVREELTKRQDTLAEWAKDSFNGWRAAKSDPLVQQHYSEVIRHVNGLRGKSSAAKYQFANKADGWIVAYAVAYSAIVVTHEKSVSETSQKIKIPDVCHQFNVECIRLVEMLRRLNVTI
jgi:hypothetical protein|uniref:DUF4411 family protein n=2 Tax=Thermorudis TaxID=1649508 RepID=A0A7C3AQ22_9BACT